MASNNRFQPGGRHVHVAGENYLRSNSPSRSVSPGPVDETASDYFNPISQAPSQTSLSRYPSQNPSQASLSAFPSYQDPTSINTAYNQQNPPPARRRPPVDQARQPSIRIRRSSNGSVYSNYSFDGFSDDGRPRSVSQPERARTHDGPALARHSRRVPQAAMPRLTEEGGRPSMAELGISDDDRAMSPTASLPDDAMRPKQGRLRRASRFFWPGNHHRRQGGDDTMAVPMRNRDDNPNPDDEYDQNLVDWLDVIGKLPKISSIPITNTPQIPKSKPSRPSQTSKTPSSSPISENGSTVDQHTLFPAMTPKPNGPAVLPLKNVVAKQPKTIVPKPPPSPTQSTKTPLPCSEVTLLLLVLPIRTTLPFRMGRLLRGGRPRRRLSWMIMCDTCCILAARE